MARTVKLIKANFRSASIRFTPAAVTTVHISAPFEQIVAEQLGLKSKIYGRKAEDEPDIDSYGVGIDWVGATVTIKPPDQGELFKKILDEEGMEFPGVHVKALKIARHKDDQQQLITLHVIVLDDDSKFDQLLKGIKKSDINIDIKPPTQKSEKEALEKGRQAGLFPTPKEKKESKETPEPEPTGKPN